MTPKIAASHQSGPALVDLQAPADAAPHAAVDEKTLADRAVILVRAEILSGQLAPGQRLRLNELQARFGLGLSPLREALMRLSGEGLTRGEAQRGFAVAPVSLAELDDLTRTRQQLEQIALRQSIERGDADWEAEVLASFHRLSRTPRPAGPADGSAADLWEARHRAFHNTLVVACDSPWLLRFLRQLADHTERYRRIRLLVGGSGERLSRRGDSAHRALLDAVLARDADKACVLIARHLEVTAEFIRGLWRNRAAGQDQR